MLLQVIASITRGEGRVRVPLRNFGKPYPTFVGLSQIGQQYFTYCKHRILSQLLTFEQFRKRHAMDALVYEDTPIASYFEGEALPFDLLREKTPPLPPFAPQGLPNFKGRLRSIRRSASSIAPGSAYTEELLEKFRYLIVASQLLTDEVGPRPPFSETEHHGRDFTTLRGAAVTAVASFLAAWAIHWFKTRKSFPRPHSWAGVGICAAGAVLIGTLSLFFARRQHTNHLQRASIRTLTKYVDDSQSLDGACGNIIRFIQEVEVVARGYDLSTPLPPISRLEDRQVLRRCQTLRRELAAALKLLTIILVESHTAMQPYLNKLDLQRYHDIYEISLTEYSHAVGLVNEVAEEGQETLKELRFSINLHALARKVLLCDLLALQQSFGWLRFNQWSHTLRVLRELDAETAHRCNDLSSLLAEEEWGSQHAHKRSRSASSSCEEDDIPESSIIKTQIRRFDDVAQSVRALNAKIHLMKEEINGLMNAHSGETVMSSTISRHYASVGSEIQYLLSEWERGKAHVAFQHDMDHERGSCSSGSVLTPISPSPNLGPLQIVDGGPADALRLLSGDSPSTPHTHGLFEEEVFEAVANRLPRKRMSVSAMTREEKMAKLAEDRRKRATLQEQADNTTNMLRELQMVIKHRPKSSISTNTAQKATGNRIATI